MHKGRTAHRLRLGRWLALFALSLRLVAPSLPAPAPPAADAAELVRLFGPHAFCLSQEAGDPGSGPADRPGSDEVDHRFGTCCFWHCSGSLDAPTPVAVAPVAFLISGVSFPASTPVVVAARRAGIARARAPPREA